MTNYWLVVTDPKNFAINKQRKFDVEGFQDLYKNTVKNVIKPNDKFVHYIKGYKKFGSISEAISTYYYCEEKIWDGMPKDPNEIFPHRFKIRPILVPANNELLDAKKLVPQLNFISTNQKATSWGLAFRRSLRHICQKDFELIQSEMKKSGFFKDVKLLK